MNSHAFTRCALLALLVALLTLPACDTTGDRNAVQVELYRPSGANPGLPDLQMRVVAPAEGVTAYVYGTFSPEGLPLVPSVVVGEGKGDRQVSVAVLDKGFPRLLYSADKATGERSEALIEMEPIDASSFFFKVYRYDWARGAGQLVLMSRLTRSATGFDAQVVFADTLRTGAGVTGHAAPALLGEDTALPPSPTALDLAAREAALWQGALPSANAARALDCDTFLQAVDQFENVGTEFLDKVKGAGNTVLLGALGATFLQLYPAAVVLALAGGALKYPAQAMKVAQSVASTTARSACGDGRLKNPLDEVRLPKISLPRLEEVPFTGGSIAVRDNGSLADDAFEVSLNGRVLGTTAIGASNTVALGALAAGDHTLRIRAVIAPDNVATYGISLSGGLTFSGGATARSGSMPLGGTATFTVVAPRNRWLQWPA